MHDGIWSVSVILFGALAIIFRKPYARSIVEYNSKTAPWVKNNARALLITEATIWIVGGIAVIAGLLVGIVG